MARGTMTKGTRAERTPSTGRAAIMPKEMITQITTTRAEILPGLFSWIQSLQIPFCGSQSPSRVAKSTLADRSPSAVSAIMCSPNPKDTHSRVVRMSELDLGDQNGAPKSEKQQNFVEKGFKKSGNLKKNGANSTKTTTITSTTTPEPVYVQLGFSSVSAGL